MAEKNGKNYVVDTSVLIKWLGEETEDLEQANKVREDYVSENIGILVPALVFWELSNYFGRRYDGDSAGSAFLYFQNFRFRPYLMSLELSMIAFKIMKKYEKVSFYDASYHALAIFKNTVYLTADKKYYDKTHKLGNIQLLHNYK